MLTQKKFQKNLRQKKYLIKYIFRNLKKKFQLEFVVRHPVTVHLAKKVNLVELVSFFSIFFLFIFFFQKYIFCIVLSMCFTCHHILLIYTFNNFQFCLFVSMFFCCTYMVIFLAKYSSTPIFLTPKNTHFLSQ